MGDAQHELSSGVCPHQIKTIMINYLTPVRVAIIRKTRSNQHWGGCGENRTLYTAAKSLNWYISHCGKQYGGFSKNKNRTTTLYRSIPLLGTYLRKTKTVV